MAISDDVMSALGITRSTPWTAGSVVNAALPHLAWGRVTVLALPRRIDAHTIQVSSALPRLGGLRTASGP
jgi:hypothetical protein